jgi:hypothetical protein
VAQHQRLRRDLTTLRSDPRPVLRRIVLLNATGNVTSGFSLIFADPGVSGTLNLISELTPLPLLGAALTAAGVLQLCGNGAVVWGHGIGAACWLFIAGSALTTVLTGTQTSGAGALLLAGLLMTVAGMHLNGILFRRQEAITARRGET